MSRILITGASGAVGQALVALLADSDHQITATDIAPALDLPDTVTFEKMDVRGTDPDQVIARTRPDVVIHLASIVNPTTRAFAYDVDVTGSQNVLNACLAHGVNRLVVTSSGAAYGYHPDTPVPLREDTPIRGNPEFAYSDHKRQVEEMLAEARIKHPDLEQVILRVGTVLDTGMENQITALFHKPRLLAIAGHDSPFVFIWRQDLAQILARAATTGPTGIFNVAGDGWMGVRDLAATLGKPILALPAWALKLALAIANPLKLSKYGPQQVRFLQYRPVLDNTALKHQFGYTPQKTSAQTFDLWRKGAGL